MSSGISSVYLDKGSVARFKKVQGKLESCYQHALGSSPINISRSDYIPKVYVVPFVRKVVLPDREIFVFNEVLPDPFDREHNAFILSLPFLEIIQEKFVTANFAHEFAHLIDFTEHQTRIGELRKKHKDNAGLIYTELEQKIAEYYERFKEPVRTWLHELDEESNKTRIYNQIIESGVEIREFHGIYEFSEYLKTANSQ